MDCLATTIPKANVAPTQIPRQAASSSKVPFGSFTGLKNVTSAKVSKSKNASTKSVSSKIRATAAVEVAPKIDTALLEKVHLSDV